MSQQTPAARAHYEGVFRLDGLFASTGSGGFVMLGSGIGEGGAGKEGRNGLSLSLSCGS